MKTIKGGLSYDELRKMANHFERFYKDDTAYQIACDIRSRVQAKEQLESLKVYTKKLKGYHV